MRVLVVEDEPWIRRGLETMLRAEKLDVVATSRGRDAVETARTSVPDAAIVDLGLPDMSGIEVIAELREVAPTCSAVAFTVFDDAKTIYGALRAGARGYVLKNAPSKRIVPALREAMAGGMPLSPPVAKLVVEMMLGADASPSPRRPPALTQRETELLGLLARGATYAECAQEMDIGVGTVQSYVKSIYAKLDVGSKAEAAVIAVRLGLLT